MPGPPSCVWKTVAGKRVRFGPVAGPIHLEALKRENVRERMAALGLVVVSASPELTIDDLRDAVLTLWLDPEKGYLMEARIKPGATPIYHSIGQLEATAWEAGAPTPEFIARMFTRVEPALN